MEFTSVQTIPTLNVLRQKRAEIIALASRYGAYNVRVFGSVARGEATHKSDVDILVQFAPNYRLLKHSGLIIALQNLLGCRVDVSVEEHLRPEYQQGILRDAVPL